MPALVQRPAPTFTAEAVVEGTFAQVSLQDFLGQWYEPRLSIICVVLCLLPYRVVLLFYPM
jgi:hypothetical protein